MTPRTPTPLLLSPRPLPGKGQFHSARAANTSGFEWTNGKEKRLRDQFVRNAGDEEAHKGECCSVRSHLMQQDASYFVP